MSGVSSRTRGVRPAGVGVGLLGCLMVPALAASKPPVKAAPVKAGAKVELVQYNRDIRLILSDNCFACHGPDRNARKANLRLDLRDDAIAKGAIVPGKPEKSSLVARIFSTGNGIMPPVNSHKVLTPAQKSLFKRWVAEGAKYEGHWSFIPPKKVQVAKSRLQLQKEKTGKVNPVDAYVWARLEKLKLAPSVEADRRTLIRRLSFDLLGIPPTPKEVAHFEADKAPDAYEKLVDRLLARPEYGEKMAIGWLDVVRFADTIGYHSDTPRNIWPYRDYVIKSFNENKPFDRFTVEQLAGDLVEGANQETKVASAYNRLLLTTEEGGAQAKDYEARYLTDRVRSIGTTWLGLTTACGQCHDHKFDPYTTKDFYSLGAFFADIQEPIIGGSEPGMTLMTPEQEQRLKALDAVLIEAREFLPKLKAAQDEWEAKVAASSYALPELAEASKATQEEKNKANQVIAILKKAASTRNPQEMGVIESYFRQRVDHPYKVQLESLAQAEKARNDFANSLPKCIVSVSGPKRTVRILPRGNWMDESGPTVKPAVPAFLPQPKAEGRELNRLDLAQWLVSRENPLTARTVMNRMWKQFFGTGLSKVLDDLGAQGESPVNQPLLDWLAVEFMDSGWDVKHMVRTIVTSATYKQTSVARPDLVARDPYNRECARQSAFRVDAELVRDNALAISGLLVAKIGGPSVKPYQPPGYWENLNFPVREWQNDQGEGLWRRGLYTWWQRSFLQPSLLAFDAPSREECTAERNRSNIPQQALVLLNDPTYVEACRAFATRILKEGPATPEGRLNWAWLQAVQRNPRAPEAQAVRTLLEQHLAAYKADPKAAVELLKVGYAPVPEGLDQAELAAWTHVARVLLNLHETITRP